jgi:hypothetical protein
MQNIVYLILHNGQPFPGDFIEFYDGKISDLIPHLEEVGKDFVDNLPAPRAIKTHLPYDLTPTRPEAKYSYIARNPKDCVVSFYHHIRGFLKHFDFADGKFVEFFEVFMSGTVDFGDYFDNVMSWCPHFDNENVLFLT